MSHRRLRPPPPPTQAKSRRGLVPGLIAGVGALAIAGAAIGYGVASSGPSSHPATGGFNKKAEAEGTAWLTQVGKDYSPLEGVLKDLLTTVQAWENPATAASTGMGTKKTTAETVSKAIHQYHADFVLTLVALAKQKPLSLAPPALSYFRQAAQLYEQSFNILDVATTLAPGALQHQLELSATRVRTLGDRVFDLAQNLVGQYSPATDLIRSSKSVHVAYAPPVPTWASLDEAAGPPLAAAGRSGTAALTLSRAKVSLSAWKAAISHAGIPSATSEVSAIDRGSAGILRQQSASLAGAVTSLAAKPYSGAAGNRDQLLLSLLIDAEATRTAQEARLVGHRPGGKLEAAAKSVALIGDQLWLPELGARSTGFPSSLLAPRAASA